MPQPGDKILHYQILSTLGKGGMGQVFKALDIRLKREVALKFILGHDQLDTEQKQRLEVEAQAVAKLDHNNIGSLFAIEEHDDELFLAMALYQGEGLDEMLARGALPVDKALELSKQILEGLSHAHAKGVIHRDIKPANIFVTDKGLVKILDFGLARLPDSNLTRKGEMMGTPNYMSPELFKAEGVDHRTDIWSFAVLLFQMLTGVLPFGGKFPHVMLAILKEDPKPLSDHLDHQVLASIIERCLAKDKHERFESCDVIQQALNQHQHSMQAAVQASQSSVTASTSQRRRSPVLIGREGEILELVTLLTDEANYLITIFGMGGAGKTSLAKSVTEDVRVAPLYPDGVFFVPLDALQDANQIPFEITKVMNVQLQGQDSWGELEQSLQGKTMLLVLDNLEHLIQDCAANLEELLNTSPTLTILATSREVLSIPGEVIFDLKGLSVPPSVDADFDAYGATELFIRQAKRFKRGFNLEAEKGHVLAICQQLEGWPLGIELAVAWIRQFSAFEVAGRLKSSFEFLTTRSRTHASRHQSARAAFEYSWQLLSELEQTALVALSVFRGGFTSEAAFEVSETKLSTLAALTDKSLLTITEQGRYTSHPLVRAFCYEKLSDSDERDTVYETYAGYFLSLTEEAELHLQGEMQLAWLDRIALEHDNLLVVLDYLLTQEKLDQALHLTASLGQFWTVRGHFQLGLSWLQRLSAQLTAQAPPALRAEVLFQTGRLIRRQGDFDSATKHYEEVLILFRVLGDHQRIIESLAEFGLMAFDQAKFSDAQSHFEACLALSKEQDDKSGMGLSLDCLGMILHFQKGQYEEAKKLFEESLSFFQEANDQYGITGAINDLGCVAICQGDYREAKRRFEECLTLRRELGYQDGIARTLYDLGRTALLQGFYDEARTWFNEGFSLSQALSYAEGLSNLHFGLGTLALEQGDYQEAAWHLGESLTIRKNMGDDLGIAYTLLIIASLLHETNRYELSVNLFAASNALSKQISAIPDPQTQTLDKTQQSLEQIRELLDEQQFNKFWQKGLKLSSTEAVELALAELKSMGT